jgi:hypothetical protein
MAVARSLFVAVSCTALVLAALLVPGAVRADSNGVPPIGGVWSGKFSDTYWDQTSAGSVKPKQKFKSKVDVTIDQSVDAFSMTIDFQDPFFIDSSVGISQLILDGFGGNYHVSSSMSGAASVTLSGVANKSGTKLTLTGVGASSEFTHEITIKLKKQSP